MLCRLMRGALTSASQHSQLCEQVITRSTAAALGTSSVQTNADAHTLFDRTYGGSSASCGDAPDLCRVRSHGHASSSNRCLGPHALSGSKAHASSFCNSIHLQQLRAYRYQPPKPTFTLPEPIKALVQQKIKERKDAAERKQVIPALETRPMLETSRRVGCIATKAGMTQEWDEYGVRVPLTVLWIDECQVVGVKTRAVHGYDGIMLGAGYKRQKCTSHSQAGFFLKAGVPFKKIVAEWPVSEDALLPVGTLVGGGHFVAGQRVDVTGWTKWRGFQGVMRRWGFKGLPASHGVSLAHRSPGSIGGRADPGKVWKGKKLPGCMGNERRTVHRCLVYKVDAARNLVYVRGQVPGPVGRSVLLRDSRLASPAQRLAWGLPFPTHVPSAEQLAALPAPGDFTAPPDPAAVTVWRNPKDPYLMYREETDYFPIEWKKGE